MEHQIINCYELDIKQNIPTDMAVLISSNEKLIKSNNLFKIILMSIGIGVIISVIFQYSKPRKVDKDERII